MHIRPLEVSADEEFADFYAIEHDAELFERPGAPFASAHEEQVFLLQADPFERITAYAAFDGDRMVGAALTAFTLLDNTDKGFVQVDVAPPLRRRGIGSALVDHVVECCREAGRDTVLAPSSRYVDSSSFPCPWSSLTPGAPRRRPITATTAL